MNHKTMTTHWWMYWLFSVFSMSLYGISIVDHWLILVDIISLFPIGGFGWSNPTFKCFGTAVTIGLAECPFGNRGLAVMIQNCLRSMLRSQVACFGGFTRCSAMDRCIFAYAPFGK